MTEDQTSVVEAVAQPVEESKQDAPKEEIQMSPETKRDSDQEYNWREARREREELRLKNLELANELARMRAGPQTDDEDIAKLADDDIITVKQHKQMSARIAKQVAMDVMKEREAATLDERIKNKFPDFDNVVTKENIEIFQQNEPELAKSLKALADDPYSQAAAAYKLLKKHGMGVTAEVEKNKQKAEENSKKPVSVQSVAKQPSAVGNAHAFENGLTPELKKQLWSEMQEAAKRY